MFGEDQRLEVRYEPPAPDGERGDLAYGEARAGGRGFSS